MKQLFLCTSLLSVLALTCSAVGDNRYGGHYNSNHRNVGGYAGGTHSRGHFGAPSAPGAPSHPRSPGAPSAPLRPAPPAYGGSRHYGAPAGPAPYSAPSHYNAPAPYGAPAHGLRRSVYQPQPQVHGAAARLGGSNNYPQQHSTYQQNAQSKSQTHGREMKYTINDPHNRGQTHVTETHVVSNRQMHGAEAEAAMKKLMGSMGPGPNYGSDGGFQDFVKGMGLPFY